jgi:hypothetical protein
MKTLHGSLYLAMKNADRNLNINIMRIKNVEGACGRDD